MQTIVVDKWGPDNRLDNRLDNSGWDNSLGDDRVVQAVGVSDGVVDTNNTSIVWVDNGQGVSFGFSLGLGLSLTFDQVSVVGGQWCVQTIVVDKRGSDNILDNRLDNSGWDNSLGDDRVVQAVGVSDGVMDT